MNAIHPEISATHDHYPYDQVKLEKALEFW